MQLKLHSLNDSCEMNLLSLIIPWLETSVQKMNFSQVHTFQSMSKNNFLLRVSHNSPYSCPHFSQWASIIFFSPCSHNSQYTLHVRSVSKLSSGSGVEMKPLFLRIFMSISRKKMNPLFFFDHHKTAATKARLRLCTWWFLAFSRASNVLL